MPKGFTDRDQTKRSSQDDNFKPEQTGFKHGFKHKHDIPLPTKDKQITAYADDITITASHTKHRNAQQLIKPYLHKIYEWATTNNLHINTDKTTTTLFTPEPAEYSRTLSLKLNNKTLLRIKHPKILEITLDPKLTFSQHINVTITKTNA